MALYNRPTPLHLDMLKEAGNIGAGRAATSMSEWLDKTVEMKVPYVSIVPLGQLTPHKEFRSMRNVIKVGIAEMNVADSTQLIRTIGLGSCVGVVVYDSKIKTAAMAHIMLPDSRLAKGAPANAAKFADLAMEALVALLKSKGSSGSGLKAKMAGGAQMFQLAVMSEITRIGSRNVEAIEKQLARFRIKKVASDVGGNCGRTIEFDPENEKLTIRTVHQGISEI